MLVSKNLHLIVMSGPKMKHCSPEMQSTELWSVRSGDKDVLLTGAVWCGGFAAFCIRVLLVEATGTKV